MTAAIGHNSDAFTVARDTVNDLLGECREWLDGKPIANAEQAQGVRLLQDRLRAAHGEGDASRMAATKPHRDAEKAINDQWRPVLAPAKTALDVIGKVMGAWQAEEARKRDDEAAAARQQAEQATRAAQEHLRASAGHLAEREAAEAKLAEAERLTREADAKAKASVGVRSVAGGRASALIVHHVPEELTDAVLALRWVREHRPDQLKAALLDIITKAKARDVPGVRYETITTAR